jgi:hypothetical protein
LTAGVGVGVPRVVRIVCSACFVACGGGAPPSSAVKDASAESALVDAGQDDVSCFPYCGTVADARGATSGGDAAGDGALSCDELRALYEALEGRAQSCNPQLPAQCNATTDGPCCPLTVGTTDRAAIDDFDQAVAVYKTQCSPDCSKVICQPAPSNRCDALGSLGRCE